MSIVSDRRRFIASYCFQAVPVLLLLFAAIKAGAEPYLAVKTGYQCSVCHVNPTGGGARNSFGAHYGSQILPATAGDSETFDAGQINTLLRLGGDLRFDFLRTELDDGDTDSGFNTQSGQLYFTVQPGDSPVSLHIDHQIAPGGARNREAFILARFGGQHYLKAGNIILPYGIRLQDSSTFVREASQINFSNSDNGVELGLNYGGLALNIAASNGTSQTSNDDDRFLYAFRGEYIKSRWRLGAGYILNNAEIGERILANVFGGLNLLNFIFLFEFARIEDESVINQDGNSQLQYVSLAEVNREIIKGYNLKFTSEWLDPDDGIPDNERTRHSLLLEYTPYASLQLRGGVRVGDDNDINRPQGDFNQLFLQLHFYY